MSLFALISLIVSISCASMATLTFLQARNRVHWVWGIFNLNVALWCLGLFLAGVAQSSQMSLLYWRLALVSNTFISVFLYHLIYSLCKLNEKRLLILIYLQGVLFALIALFYKPFLSEVRLIFNTIYYAKATPLISLWFLVFSFTTGIAFYRILQFVKTAHGEEKTQALYLFWGMIVGFAGGFTIALPLYDIPIYPGWHFLICIYAGIFTFSILRHRFLDIRVGLIRMLIPACILMAILFVLCFIYFKMTLFSVASLSVAILCSLLAFIVFAYSTKRVHQIWAVFNVIVAVWGLANFAGGMSVTPEKALIFWRLECVVTTFLSVVYYHVIAEFCGIHRPRMLLFAYIQGILFVPLIIFSKHFLGSTYYAFDSMHYYKATILFTLWALIWFLITGSAFIELHKFIKRSKGIIKTQALYMFWAPLLGHTGGAITIIPAFGIPLYPAFHFSVCVYAAVMTYAMFRYQLMDIRIAVTRLGVFVIVYSLVLGIPFGLVVLGKPWLINILGENWFWAPMVTLLVLATSGPFIYLFVQRKAEDVLLQEERRINSLLTQASYGMTTIRNLTKLLDFIVDVLRKILGVEKAEVFILNQAINEYELKAPVGENGVLTVNGETALIEDLMKRRVPLVGDEIKSRAESNPDSANIQDILSEMNRISCSVIVPIAIDSALLGFIVLGDREGKETYSNELLNVLGVLGNQAALAVKNCYFLEEEAARMEKLGLEERRVSLDHLTSSMAHEIDNPMMVIHGQVEGLQEAFQDLRISMPDDLRERVDKSMEYILEARSRVSGMIQAIKEYSRKTTGLLKLIKIYEVEEGYWKLFGYEFKREENRQIKYIKEISDNLPHILGDKIQLEEVFFNLANNAIHAVQRSEVKEIKLKIFQKDEDWIRMEYSDTGCGIEKNIIGDIFLAHITTKGSTEGSGLGLYRVRKIIELHNGRIWAESAGKNKGAKIIVEFPVFKGDIKAYLDKGKTETPKKMF